MGHRGSVEKSGPGMAGLIKIVKQLAINPEVKVGVLANEPEREPVLEGHKDSDVDAAFRKAFGSGVNAGEELSNVAIACINEFGSAKMGIPARPFIGTSGDHFKEAWLQLMEHTLGLVVDGKITPQQALEIVGQRASADMKKVLLTAMWPPNAPRTIAAKGSSRPLVDTRQLLNSISYAVKVGGSNGKVWK